MSIFSIKKSEHVNGPNVENLKITFENLCEELQADTYTDGVDNETLCETLSDVYAYITGTTRGKALRLPAPCSDLNDRGRVLWPEGSKVRTRSRRDSHTSRASSRSSNGVRVPAMNAGYTSSRASSNTSSRYAPVRTTWIEDEAPDSGVRNFNMNSLRNSMPRESKRYTPDAYQYPQPQYPTQQVPQQGPSRRPTIRIAPQQIYEEDEVEQLDTRSKRERIGVSQPRARKSKFAEDQE